MPHTFKPEWEEEDYENPEGGPPRITPFGGKQSEKKGVPQKLDDVKDIIIEAYRLGHTQKRAAEAAGIDAKTLKRWAEDPNYVEECAEFRRELAEARAVRQAELMEVLHDEAIQNKNPKVALEILERQLPDTWSKQEVKRTVKDPEIEDLRRRLLDAGIDLNEIVEIAAGQVGSLPEGRTISSTPDNDETPVNETKDYGGFSDGDGGEVP